LVVLEVMKRKGKIHRVPDQVMTADELMVLCTNANDIVTSSIVEHSMLWFGCKVLGLSA
jgi:hypothetical protein